MVRALLWLVAVGLAGCEAPAARPLCQVPGELGRGAFAAHDCRFEEGCLDGWRFAARTVETMIFCPGKDEAVTEVSSSDPSVMVASRPLALGRGRVTFDLAAGAPGTATIEVRGPDLVERLELVVEDIGAIEITGPERVVQGGLAALTSTKIGASGAPLFGRGGYGLTMPAGLSSRPATTATQDCGLLQPDVVVSGDAVGAHQVTTDAPALPWASTIEVVPVAAVTSAQLVATRLAGNPTEGYAASVRVIGLDAGGRAVLGVTCDWAGSRPAFIINNVCWALVLVPTSEPLELTCSFDGRVLGTVRVSNAIVL